MAATWIHFKRNSIHIVHTNFMNQMKKNSWAVTIGSNFHKSTKHWAVPFKIMLPMWEMYFWRQFCCHLHETKHWRKQNIRNRLNPHHSHLGIKVQGLRWQGPENAHTNTRTSNQHNDTTVYTTYERHLHPPTQASRVFSLMSDKSIPHPDFLNHISL